MSRQAQAVVVGGGLAGTAAAIALARAGIGVIHLSPPTPPDRRTSALMLPSVDILAELGLVAAPESIAHPLRRIRIIDATDRLIRAPETLFDAGEAGLSAFGWNFPNATLLEQFRTVAEGFDTLETLPLGMTSLAADNGGYLLTLSDGSTIRAELVVGADGKGSPVRAAAGIGVRETRFAQSALVCDLDLARSLDGTSVEFHYPNGPFTLVPAGGNRANLVWIDRQDILDAARTSGPDALIATFEQKSQHLFGRIGLASPSFVFPLSNLAVATAGKDGVVLVGEAAHAFPPIGAQGLNLGLRDVADLADAIRRHPPAPGWAQRVATTYAASRSADLGRTGGMVDALFRSLLADMLPAQAARAGGLWALKLLPGLRRQAFAIGMGGR